MASAPNVIRGVMREFGIGAEQNPFAGIDRSVHPEPLWSRRPLGGQEPIPHRRCTLPEQMPGKDALALLAVSRDADEEAPDEHAPGSRGHVMRRAIGCDFGIRRGIKPRPTRARDRFGDDRRVVWFLRERERNTLFVRIAGANIGIVSDETVPPNQMVMISGQDQYNFTVGMRVRLT